MSEDAKLKVLHHQRGALKRKLKDFSTFINDLKDMQELSQVHIKNIETRTERFIPIVDQLQEIQNKILSLSVVDENDENDYVSNFEESYFNILADARVLVDEYRPADKNTSQISNVAPAANNIKLPTINLPQFNGSYDQWISFRDTFEALINQNNSLSIIQKFYYLKSALRQEALQVIQSLEIANNNYDIAWNLLKERYENERIIVQGHISALFELQSIQKESAVKLRHLCDNTMKHLRALNAIITPENTLNALLVHLVSTKLDYSTRREWGEANNTTQKIATIDEFTKFLSNRAQLLETLESNKNLQPKQGYIHQQPHRSQGINAHSATFTKTSCHYCKNQHYIFRCPTFLSLTIARRIVEIKRLKLCMNCMNANHFYKDCKALNCRKCSKKHNTLLHEDEISTTSENANEQEQAVSCASTGLVSKPGTVILSTAEVIILDDQGREYKARALLDSGSQAHFITKQLCNKMKFKCRKINIPVCGIGKGITPVCEQREITLKLKFNNFTATLNCLVLPKIIGKTPHMHIDTSMLNIPRTIKMSDPSFNEPRPIDLLIGAELFYSLLCVGQIKLGKSQPVLQKSLLGWIISGSIQGTPTIQTALCCTTDGGLNDQVERFWKQEEPILKQHFSREETLCEKHFIKNVTRDCHGRYSVSLPLKENHQTLGQSYNIALKRFMHLEHKLQLNPQLQRDYSKFIDEYKGLGHMSISHTQGHGYFLPHHAVIKVSSSTTKTRVVFDGSSKTTNGTSLNDILMVGPTIQDDLFTILLRFRTHKYVMTADIEKMYRQVKVREEDRHLQQIIWRDNPSEPINTYTLNTVTYGTACAPFLAIRSLRQLAIDEGTTFPKASKVLLSDFYVDDLITGAATLEEANQLQTDITTLLSQGQFNLRQWKSNSDTILKNIKPQTGDNLLSLDKQGIEKTLGLMWNSCTDELLYQVKLCDTKEQPTKRNILSAISQIYDPLGLIGPVLIRAKLIMQQLWQLQVNWDESIPTNLHTTWLETYKTLHELNNLRIPRFINPSNNTHSCELHGFSDASELAYGACIYVKYNNSMILLCSKARVAPLKSVSLPRLELCGALVLTQLMQKVRNTINIDISKIYCWTDSTIVLCWISTEPNKLKTYVANRISEIQQASSNITWRHIPSKSNPADIISRGLSPSDLLESSLWWEGPEWILHAEENWIIIHKPELNKHETEQAMSEVKPATASIATFTITIQNIDILTKYSSFRRLQRIIAYSVRFVNNARNKQHTRRVGQLDTEDLHLATERIIFLTQSEAFKDDIRALSKGKGLTTNSKLLNLNPYLDNNGLLRVGGRLENSDITLDQKHPFILPAKHHITDLIIRQEHEKLHHCGQEQLLATIRLEFWPIAVRQAAKRVIHNCYRCFRFKPRVAEHLMGNLPRARIRGNHRPFTISGVDYAGPIQLKESRRRGRPFTTKAYVAVFVCFSTKAVHLELVSDLTTEAFMAALRRFISRRGICSELHSDNGRNFVGAQNHLKEITNFLHANNDNITRELASKDITWKFIPPRAPHFGGIWEAAVKAMKRHLYKVTQTIALTFEETSTLLTEIEAILNSRPLVPLSSHPNDLSPLTPSHFLIGDSILSTVEHDYTSVPSNRLSLWQHLQFIKQHFWKRWYKEYLHHLQQRYKWQTSSPGIKIGTLVILVEDNSPPFHWPMARIIETFPSNDGIVRVVLVKTSQGVYKRPVKRLCMLPNQD